MLSIELNLHEEPLAVNALSRQEELFFDGDHYFEALLRSLASAQRVIHFETYYFEEGPLGKRVRGALVAAAQRGVRVRLLIDGVGSLDFHREAELLAAGVKFHYYHPISRIIAGITGLGMFTPLVRIARFRRFFGRLNHRDHRKLCIIDNLEIWMGSFNVSSLTLRSVHGDRAWRDTGIRIRGVDTAPFELAFHVTWYDHLNFILKRASQKKLMLALRSRIHKSSLRTNTSRKMRLLFFEDQIARVSQARTRVWITTPYFIPPRELLNAIITTAGRGVDVRILLPGPSDVPIVSWVSSLLYSTFIGAGVHIFEYQPSMLHAKCLIIDEWASLGSSNLNSRSSLHDIEANYATTLPSTLLALQTQFAADLGASLEVGPTSASMKHGLKYLLARLFVSFKYWM